MVDNRIQILIEGQDKISATLSNIESKIKKFGDENKTATDKMINSWQKGTNSLIAIGNAAASVDNIFSSLTNLSIRLENASERLANAQDRLEDSQLGVVRANKDLVKIQKTYNFVLKNHLEDTEYGIRVLDAYEEASRRVEDAQKAEERATRGLIISENNLERAQNQVIGTYISIGIQSLSLIASIPSLISALSNLSGSFGTISSQAGLVSKSIGIAGVAGVGIGIIGGLFALYKIMEESDYNLYQDKLKELEKRFGDLDEKILTTLKDLLEFENYFSTRPFGGDIFKARGTIISPPPQVPVNIKDLEIGGIPKEKNIQIGGKTYIVQNVYGTVDASFSSMVDKSLKNKLYTKTSF